MTQLPVYVPEKPRESLELYVKLTKSETRDNAEFLLDQFDRAHKRDCIWCTYASTSGKVKNIHADAYKYLFCKTEIRSKQFKFFFDSRNKLTQDEQKELLTIFDKANDYEVMVAVITENTSLPKYEDDEKDYDYGGDKPSKKWDSDDEDEVPVKKLVKKPAAKY